MIYPKEIVYETVGGNQEELDSQVDSYARDRYLMAESKLAVAQKRYEDSVVDRIALRNERNKAEANWARMQPILQRLVHIAADELDCFQLQEQINALADEARAAIEGARK